MRIYTVFSLFICSVISAEITLKPASNFDATVSAAAILPSKVYFEGIRLVRDEIHLSYISQVLPMQRGVVRFSLLGTLLGSISLPLEAVEVIIDDQGKSLILRQMQDGTKRLESYSLTGKLEASQPLIGISRLAVLGEMPVLLTGDGTLMPGPRSFEMSFSAIRTPGLPVAVHLATVDRHTLAIVDRFQPSYRLVDIADSSVRSIPIDAPGLSAAIKAFDNAMAYAPSRAVRPLLFYAAAAGNGHLFLPVSGIKLNEGMLLIELGRNGEHIQNLRLLPIALSRLKQEGNSEGWVLQNKLSIAGSKIATVSASGIVSIFQTGR